MAANRGQFGAPTSPRWFGHIARLICRIAQAERVWSRHLGLRMGVLILGVLDEVFVMSVGTPHTATLSARAAKTVELAPSFAESAGPWTIR